MCDVSWTLNKNRKYFAEDLLIQQLLSSPAVVGWWMKEDKYRNLELCQAGVPDFSLIPHWLKRRTPGGRMKHSKKPFEGSSKSLG